MTKSNMVKIFLLQLNYKSGITIQAWFSKFEFTKQSNGDFTYNYKSAGKSAELAGLASVGKTPLMLGFEDIESIFQLQSEEVQDYFPEDK